MTQRFLQENYSLIVMRLELHKLGSLQDCGSLWKVRLCGEAAFARSLIYFEPDDPTTLRQLPERLRAFAATFIIEKGFVNKDLLALI